MRAQDRPDEFLGLPGDNLNLYAVMKLFQESETLEGFERNLNDQNSRINNLDLNGDNMVDYITVSDYVDSDVHTIVLQAALNRNESHDVAVFTVQRLRNGEVQIQLIGDEALYGRNYIIEPNYAETSNPGYRGNRVNRADVTIVTSSYYDIATWPMIRFIYQPAYIGWHSSWYWGYYPVYWNPWRPWYWDYYYGYHSNWYPDYYMHYRHWDHYRYNGYHDNYYGRIRKSSPMVARNINRGTYKSTYSHPEQRRDGEKLYASTQSTRNRGTRAAATGSQERRPAMQQAQNRNTAATGTAGRTTETAASRTVKSSSTVQRTATTRRAATTVNARPGVASSAGKSTGTSQRSVSTATERTTSRPSMSVQRTEPARKSSPAATERTASRPSMSVQRTEPARKSSPSATERTTSRPSMTVQRTEPARSSRSSAPIASRASGSNSQVSKSAPAANRSSNAKESEKGNSRRR